MPAADGTDETQRAGTTRDVQREATRARLVAVVVELLEQGGEQAVKVGEIASSLDLSIGSVYHHFENREGLIVAARVAQFEGLVKDDAAAFRAIVERCDTLEQYRVEIRALVRASQTAERNKLRRVRAELAGVAIHNPRLAEALAIVQSECTNEYRDIIELSQRKGLGNPNLDARAVAVFAQGLSLGLVLDDINTIDPVDREQWGVLTDHLMDNLLTW